MMDMTMLKDSERSELIDVCSMSSHQSFSRVTHLREFHAAIYSGLNKRTICSRVGGFHKPLVPF